MCYDFYDNRRSFQALFQIQMPTVALTHDEVLRKVCGVCLRKPKNLRNISKNVLALIVKHHHSHYSVTSGDFPSVICPSCQRALRDAEKCAKSGDISNSKLPESRYGNMSLNTRATRSVTTCQCSWCSIWRLNGEGGAYKEYCEEVRDKPGRPLEHEPVPDPAVKDICQACGGERKRGVAHVCNVTSLENNTMRIVEGMSGLSQQRMAARILDNIREDQAGVNILPIK